jgi:antitoxin component YwqK of YwqJK toxin-antitoxin module
MGNKQLTKRFFLFFIIILILTRCSNSETTAQVVPEVYKLVSDKGFVLKQGVLYLSEKPFTGKQFDLYVTGDTALVTQYYNGREHGVCRQWYENKQLKEERYFLNGYKTGVHTGWWDNGQLQFVYHFNNDVFEGAAKEWYENGRLFRNMNYVKGIESGRQQIWQPDGKVFANYEVRNGRNYGLTGTMHCKNYRSQVIAQKER